MHICDRSQICRVHIYNSQAQFWSGDWALVCVVCEVKIQRVPAQKGEFLPKRANDRDHFGHHLERGAAGRCRLGSAAGVFNF